MTIEAQHITTGNRRLLSSRSVFTVTLIVMVLTILSVWLFGLRQHRTIFVNSLLSTGILSIAFFLFLAIGLYRGLKLRDNIGRLTDKIKTSKIPADVSGTAEIPVVGEGPEGIIISIGLWLMLTFLGPFIIWLFGSILWAGILVFIAMLYWIFFRALRLVLKNSGHCKGNLTRSMAYGLGYTIFYIGWIYGIILITHYIIP